MKSSQPCNIRLFESIIFALGVKGRNYRQSKCLGYNLRQQREIENTDLCWIRLKLVDVSLRCVYISFATYHRNIYQHICSRLLIQSLTPSEDMLQLLATNPFCANDVISVVVYNKEAWQASIDVDFKF